jgi:SAM-dependent methyltransferase
MGLVFGEEVLEDYKTWQGSRQGRIIALSMEEFLVRLLQPRAGERVLEVGCCMGDTLKLLSRLGLQAAGVDPSAHALAIAEKRAGKRCLIRQASAEDLPFEDNEFDSVLMVNTLEFVEDPEAALKEAARVASNRVVIMCMNRWSFAGLGNLTRAVLGDRFFAGMRSYSLWGVRGLIREVCGPVPILWASIRGPLPLLSAIPWLTYDKGGVGACPFGLMFGISANLVYRLRADPLTLPIRLKSAGNTAG